MATEQKTQAQSILEKIPTSIPGELLLEVAIATSGPMGDVRQVRKDVEDVSPWFNYVVIDMALGISLQWGEEDARIVFPDRSTLEWLSSRGSPVLRVETLDEDEDDEE